MQEADKSVFLVFAPVIISELYACRSIMQISNLC